MEKYILKHILDRQREFAMLWTKRLAKKKYEYCVRSIQASWLSLVLHQLSLVQSELTVYQYCEELIH